MPAWFNFSPENVATPSTAVALSVPPRVAPSGLLASATATLPLKDVTTSSESSSMATVRPKPAPTTTLLGGWFVTTMCSAFAVVGSTRPIPPAVSVNHKSPSGAAAIALIVAPRLGSLNCEIASVVGLISPIPSPNRVNQRLPSPPVTIPTGWSSLDNANSVI